MKRTEIKNNFQKAESNILKLEKENNELSLNFKTSNKFIDKFGFINEISSTKELIKLQTFIDSNFINLNDSAKKLGLEEIITSEESTFLGFPQIVWDADLKNQAKILTNKIKIGKLEKIRKVLKKNLSEDDKFELSIENISGDLNLLNDDNDNFELSL